MNSTQLTPVKNDAELQERLNTLPAFSKDVYDTLHAALYAEAFFSDVTVEDLAKTMVETTEAVRAALKRLMEAGLVYSEHYNANRRTRIFLHTYQHDKYEVL